MIRSVPNTDRGAAPWALTNGWLEWLGRAATAVRRGMRRLCGLGTGTPELRMDREWLDQHEQQSRKHPDGI